MSDKSLEFPIKITGQGFENITKLYGSINTLGDALGVIIGKLTEIANVLGSNPVGQNNVFTDAKATAVDLEAKMEDVKGEAKEVNDELKSKGGRNGLDDVKDSAVKAEGKVESLQDRMSKFGMSLFAIRQVVGAFSSIAGSVDMYVQAHTEAELASQKLTVIMRQRMNATDGEIDSIKQLALEQQKIGIIDADIAISGTQQIATFVKRKDSLERLMPAMNNLLAQQKGVNATETDAIAIANMMGKAMDGSADVLKRVGISFSDAEAKVLKYGNEEQRAAMLAQVISSNVGEMNEALAQTPEGKLKQAANTAGDADEAIGRLVVNIKSFFAPVMNVLNNALGWFFTQLADGNPIIVGITSILGLFSAAMTVALFRTQLFAMWTGITSAATAVWTSVQTVFNAVMAMNPVGAIVLAVIALIGAITYVIMKTDGWGKTWDNVMTYISLAFDMAKGSLQLTWLKIENMFLSGFDVVRKAWLKLESLWSSDNNEAALKKIDEDAKKREQRIKEAYGKQTLLANKMAGMKVMELTWNDKSMGDIVNDIKSSMGMGDNTSLDVASGTGSGSKTTDLSLEGVTGSTTDNSSKIKNINITIDKLVDKFEINTSTVKESAENIKEVVLEALTSAINDVNLTI
jgi:hypothetical protein